MAKKEKDEKDAKDVEKDVLKGLKESLRSLSPALSENWKRAWCFLSARAVEGRKVHSQDIGTQGMGCGMGDMG